MPDVVAGPCVLWLSGQIFVWLKGGGAQCVCMAGACLQRRMMLTLRSTLTSLVTQLMTTETTEEKEERNNNNKQGLWVYVGVWKWRRLRTCFCWGSTTPMINCLQILLLLFFHVDAILREGDAPDRRHFWEDDTSIDYLPPQPMTECNS